MAATGNVVDIKVKSTNDTKPGFDAATRDAKTSGGQAGQGWLSSFGSWLAPSKMQLIGTGALAGLAALPAAAGIMGAAAGIEFGAKLLIGTKKQQGPLYDSFKQLTDGIHKTMLSAVAPLIGPLKQAFAQFGGFMREIGPQIKAVFSAIAPMVMPLTRGLEGLIRGVLPGFVALMKAAQPAMQAFGQLLGTIGHALGGMFQAMAPAVKASAGVLRMLGDLVSGLMPVIGKLAAALAKSLGPVLEGFGSALHSLMPALLTVGKVLGSLAGAILQSLAGAFKAIAELVKAAAPGFKILADALAQVFQLMENSGVFGILENALEAIARPLGNMIAALAKGLAPILPPLFRFITQVAGILANGLGAAIAGVLPSLTRLALVVLKGLAEILPVLLPVLVRFVQAFTPAVVGVITGIADALVTIIQAVPPKVLAGIAMAIGGIVLAVKAWGIAQGILNIALDANPIGLIVIAAAALVLGLIALYKHSAAFRDIVREAGRVAADVFKGIIRVVGDAVSWIKDHWKILLIALTGPIGLAIVAITDHWRGFMQFFGGVISWIGGHWKLVVTLLSGPVGLAVSWIVSHWRQVSHVIGDVISYIRSDWGNVERLLIRPVESAVKWILHLIGDVSHAISGVLSAASSLTSNSGLGGLLHHFGLASGGIVGAATGGIRSNLTMVGERGPELVRLPAGSQVFNNSQSAGMLGGGRETVVRLEVTAAGSSAFEQFMLRALRQWVRVRGGDVQTVLGRG